MLDMREISYPSEALRFSARIFDVEHEPNRPFLEAEEASSRRTFGLVARDARDRRRRMIFHRPLGLLAVANPIAWALPGISISGAGGAERQSLYA
jgi:hypothetical protein